MDTNTEADFLFALKAVSGITCLLSMLGAGLIIATYVAYRDLRTLGRQQLVNLSLADMTVAASHFCRSSGAAGRELRDAVQRRQRRQLFFQLFHRARHPVSGAGRVHHVRDPRLVPLDAGARSVHADSHCDEKTREHPLPTPAVLPSVLGCPPDPDTLVWTGETNLPRIWRGC